MGTANKIVVGNDKSKSMRVLERQKECLELRTQGMTYRQICEFMLQKGLELPSTWDERYAYRDVTSALEKLQREINETTKFVVALELQRLDQLLLVAMNLATGGELRAIDRVLKIMERRSLYLGLDTPKTVEVKDWRSEIIELMRDGRITIIDVRKELGDELAKEVISIMPEDLKLLMSKAESEHKEEIIDGEYE